MEIALMQYLNPRVNLVVPNVYWGIRGLNHECDLVKLTRNNYATEIEIKVSKADLKRDKEKRHQHKSILFKYFYFAVPAGLVNFALEEIPERAGLFSVEKHETDPYALPWHSVTKIRKAKQNKQCKAWTDAGRYKLAALGTLRILGLKKKILKLGGK